jgi:hypothetical protein
MKQVIVIFLLFIELLSCKKDTDLSPKFSNNCGIKKLKSMVIRNLNSNEKDSFIYEYDGNCRLVKSIGGNNVMTFTYFENSVKYHFNLLNVTNEAHVTDFGFMLSLNTSIPNSNYELKYDNKGFLIGIKDSIFASLCKSFYISKYDYFEGNLITLEKIDSVIVVGDEKATINKEKWYFEYSDTLKKGDINQWHEKNLSNSFYFIGMLGNTNKNLIRSLRMNNGSGRINYEYDLDNEGYIKTETLVFSANDKQYNSYYYY